MRTYIRHPADIPIEVQPSKTVASDAASVRLQNISYGGLAFHSEHCYDNGSQIIIRITSVEPVFEAQARVTWCKREKSGFAIGLEFINQEDVFKARMVEQVCHIQHYRNVVLKEQGRNLAVEEAAKEWVSQFASNFPHIGDE